MSSFAHHEQCPNPPPATRNIWYLDQESRSWREGVITESICNDRSHLSTWTFFIMTPQEKTVSVKTTSLSQKEFDFKFVKNRASSGCAPNFDSLLFPNEPEIVHYLSTKYLEKQFYHRIGDVTISLNPCGVADEVSADCDNFVKESSFFHAGHTGQQNAIVHAYTLADTAFTSMCADKYNLDKRLDQSIFVRGCSGSGKTRNVKLILDYLLSLSMRVLGKSLEEVTMLDSPRLLKLKESGASSKSISFDTSLEGRFTAVNTILASMGNACRPLNSNSSRFGRVVELGYAADCYIEDMSVECFLLETERIHTQPKKERNFHIFYELAAGASAEFKAECGIGSLADFHYTNQGGVFTRFDKISDEKEFQSFCRAFDTLQVSAIDQEEFLKCVAGVLHMGNVTFEESKIGTGGAVQFSDNVANKHHLDCVCRLLSTSKNSFQKALSKSTPASSSVKRLLPLLASDSAMLPCDVATAEAARDHLAKTVYQQLVHWVLNQYQKQKDSLKVSSDTPDGVSSVASKILLVDFFGTECMKKNSFSQFCINYCSERVHEHFVTTIFGKEQERYASEGVEWTFIPYTSNKDLIEMYAAPDTGFLSILETEAHMPNPTDEKLIQQCHNKIKSHCFKLSSSQKDQKDQKDLKEKKPRKFTIMHHIGPVSYDSHGFTERNKIARVTADMMTLFSDSSSPFVTSLADLNKEQKEDHHRLKFVSSASRTKTSTTLLQRQMDSLTFKASATKQHWLICLKPSMFYETGKFDEAVVLDQIIDRGLVPLVALTQRGYSREISFQDFVATFYDLVLLAGKCAITSDFLMARNERDWQTAAMHLLGFIHITVEILNEMHIDTTDATVTFNIENSKLNLEESVIFAKQSIFIKRAMYNYLELLSYRIRIIMVVKIQRHVRVRFFNRKVSQTSSKALSMTSSCLAYFANAKLSKVLTETNARIVLQRFAQTLLILLREKRLDYSVVMVQAHMRGFLVRRDLNAHLAFAVRLVQYRWTYLVSHKKFLRKWNAVLSVQRQFRKHQLVLREHFRNEIAIKIQRFWRSNRKVRKDFRRLDTAEINDVAKQRAVKEEFLASLDSRLAKDPLYLILLLRREEEVTRLTSRVEEVKKLAVTRSDELVVTSTKLKESYEKTRSLEATLSATKKSNVKESSSRSKDKKDLLQTIDRLQKWVMEKEKTRLKSLNELAGADSNMTSLMFDAALHRQELADIEVALAKKTQDFKDFEFSLVKNSKNANKVDYESETLKFELKAIQDERDNLQATANKEIKQHEALKAFCSVLHTRIQSNSPEIQMAEMQFGLQALQAGVSKLFARDNAKERLKATENEVNLDRAQKKMAKRQDSNSRATSPRSPRSPRSENGGVSMPDSPFHAAVSFRHFQVAGQNASPTSGSDEHVLPKYTSFRQAGQMIAKESRGRRKAKVKNLSPPTDAHGHKWKAKFLSKPTWCMICKEFITGLTTNAQHAFKCRNCMVVGHRDCCEHFKCQCQTIVFNDEKDILVPADLNEHLWEAKVANVEEKCELCDTYISDTIPAKSPFKCRRCKVFGHRDCCAKFSLEQCGHNTSVVKRSGSSENSKVNITGKFEALVDTMPTPDLETNSHTFLSKYFKKPTWCFYCKQFVVGLTISQQNGVKCSSCKVSCHRECAVKFNEGNEAKRDVCPAAKK